MAKGKQPASEGDLRWRVLFLNSHCFLQGIWEETQMQFLLFYNDIFHNTRSLRVKGNVMKWYPVELDSVRDKHICLVVSVWKLSPLLHMKHLSNNVITPWHTRSFHRFSTAVHTLNPDLLYLPFPSLSLKFKALSESHGPESVCNHSTLARVNTKINILQWGQQFPKEAMYLILCD